MRIFITIIATLLLSACALLRNTVEIGMTESEFKQKNVQVYLSEMTEEYTIYRLPQDESRDLFVYFEKGRLVRVQEIIYRPDLIIEKRQN